MKWKKSAGSIERSQIDRLIDIDNDTFLNYDRKEVILYIDEPLSRANSNALRDIEYAREKGVIIINSLEDLRKVVK